MISCPMRGCTERITYRFGNPVCPKHGIVSLESEILREATRKPTSRKQASRRKGERK